MNLIGTIAVLSGILSLATGEQPPEQLLLSVTTAPNLDRYAAAQTALRTVIAKELQNNNIPLAVRLAFHDCVGPAGCNGCVNPNNPANAGLEGIVTTLGEVRTANGLTDISNADFWQIAGITALEEGSKGQFAPLNIQFKGGRKDCPDPNQEPTNEFPEPSMTRSKMMKWFRKDFKGMNRKKVTALLGAHSLGGASKANSGFEGTWTPGNKNVFNQEFYCRLHEGAWNFNITEISPGKFQWETALGLGGSADFMLNTDIELVFDIDVPKNGGPTTCIPCDMQCDRFPHTQLTNDNGETNVKCKESNTKDLVEHFCGSIEEFYERFTEAYELMMKPKKGNNPRRLMAPEDV